MACNCGRRGTPNEGRCIFCLEKTLDGRITIQVRDIIREAIAEARPDGPSEEIKRGAELLRKLRTGRRR